MASTHTHTSRDRHRKALMHAGPARDSLQYSKFQTFFLFGPESWVFLVSVYSSAVETLLSAFVHGFLDHSDKMLIQGKKYPRGVCTLVHGISSKVTVSLTRQQVDVRPRTSAIDIRLPIPDLFSDPPPPPPATHPDPSWASARTSQSLQALYRTLSSSARCQIASAKSNTEKLCLCFFSVLVSCQCQQQSFNKISSYIHTSGTCTCTPAHCTACVRGAHTQIFVCIHLCIHNYMYQYVAYMASS